MHRPLSITGDLRRWLKQAGFNNHCFISYPRARYGRGSSECAAKVKQAIAEELEQAGETAPEIFIDTTSIPPGAEWPRHLRDNLSQSVSMIAIISDLYFTSEHSWCGREWAAMEALGRSRHPDTSVKPIIPVLYRETTLPENVGRIQCVDLSRVMLSGRRYYSTNDFREKISVITYQIIQIAINLQEADCVATPVVFSDVSPFISHELNPAVQPPPLRTV